jgi:hypothetical protein
MSQNLNLLRQNYCRLAAVDGPPDLFALERDSEQGKAVLAKAPKTALHLQKFNPHGLLQTYRDESTGAELPIFAVFDLEGSHRLTSEITMASVSTSAQPDSLAMYLPFHKTQDFVRNINMPRMRAERVAMRTSVILGIICLSALVFSHTPAMTSAAVPHFLIGVWCFGAFFAYIVSQLLLNRICPWKKLVVTAEFDGILPKTARETALAAKNRFDHLYLIVDQQKRWKSALLRDPMPRALDPLLIGELKQGRRRRFFLLDQFDLTEAEQYLADEFAMIWLSPFSK